MKKTVMVLMVIIIMLTLIIFLNINDNMLVCKTTFYESDMQINNFVIVSNGSEIYLPSNLTFKNISFKNIKNVKFIIKKGDVLLYDMLFQMDNMKEYIIEHDTHLKNVGIKKSDQLTVELEYIIDGTEKKVTRLLNVKDILNGE